MKTGVYAGSFCPVTKGHVEAIKRAAKLTDKLYVVMGVNAEKKYTIPDGVRLDMLKRALHGAENIEIVSYGGMMTDFCKSVNADVMIKSIRNAVDLQSVIDLGEINKLYWDGETVFIVGDKEFRHISSSLVRELALLGKDISPYVPEGLAEEISGYYNGTR